jgi:RsiW-degrading membrane proteinase PrsW (M82 family)
METIIIIVAALLPAALLWGYIWKKDEKKEPAKWLAKATWNGALICIPAALVEMAIATILFGADGKPTTIMGTTANAFFVAAIPEEVFKPMA